MSASFFRSSAFLFMTACCLPACGQELVAQVSVETTNEPDGRLRYEYLVENLPESEFPINAFLLDVGQGADPQSIEGPEGWVSDFAAEEDPFELGWVPVQVESEIPIGGSGVFSFTSPLMPGEIDFYLANLSPDFEELGAVLDLVLGPAVPVAGLAGDYNGSGTVEQADLDLVLLNWGADGTTPPASWTNDFPQGTIDQAELDGVLLNWGNMAARAVTAGSVPEPSTWAVALLCGLAFAVGRHSTQRHREHRDRYR